MLRAIKIISSVTLSFVLALGPGGLPEAVLADPSVVRLQPSTAHGAVVPGMNSAKVDAAGFPPRTISTEHVPIPTGPEHAFSTDRFPVAGSPTLLSASPNTGQQGKQNLSVAIAGQYTHFLQGATTVNFGAGITVASLTVSSATSATAVLNIDPTAAVGVRNVTLTSRDDADMERHGDEQRRSGDADDRAHDDKRDDRAHDDGHDDRHYDDGRDDRDHANEPANAEVVRLANGFTVTSASPELLSVNPNSGQQGQQNLSVNLTGQFTHFAQGVTTASFGAGIKVVSVAVNSATSATALLNIDPAAVAGARNVTVTTNAEVVALNNGFAVTASTAMFTLGTPASFPTVVTINSPTTVTVTIAIPDPTVIPDSINLLRLNATGLSPTILGQLHDDGKNGDVLAGDSIYTISLIFNEHSVTTIQLQVSAAFRGILTRTLSSSFNVTVTATGTAPLPPDPGSAGMTTLSGIDSDGDGVRDDVQRYIALNYGSSAKLQAALTQLAKSYLSGITDNTNPQLSQLDSTGALYGIDCLYYVAPSTASQLLIQLEGQILNTRDRLAAYLTADDSQGTSFYRLPMATQQKGRCTVDPDKLPN